MVTGTVYALILYYRNKSDELNVNLKRVLAVLRGVGVTLLAFLLLSPLVRSVTEWVDKPVIVFLQDESSSVFVPQDSLLWSAYLSDSRKLLAELSENYQVDVYAFGEKIREQESDLLNMVFTDKSTDIASALEDVDARYENLNLGAVILASDGIYNRGQNPFYTLEWGNYPVFTVALGDTTRQMDLLVRTVNYNKIAYMGNEFPVEVVLQAFGCQGKQSMLEIIKNARVVYSEPVNINSDRFSRIIRASLTASEPGINSYTARVRILEGENIIANNESRFFIDVLDAKQKILILYQAAHPDVSALKEAIRSTYFYEAEDFLINDFTGSIGEYQLVILHQLPSSSTASLRVMEEIRDGDVPVLYILGSLSDINIFNGSGSGVLVDNYSDAKDEAQAWLNPDFSLFQIPDDIRQMFPSMPPLLCRSGDYRFAPSMQVMLYQKIYSAETQRPLAIMGRNADTKTGIIAGEGLWRWRLSDYSSNGNHERFNTLISHFIRYLSLDEDRKRFRVEVARQYFENQDVVLHAELYDENFNFLSGKEITIKIINESGQVYDFTFNSLDETYILDAGHLQPGIYRYHAKAYIGNEILEETGEFPVLDVSLESISQTANHNLLFRISKASGGSMVLPEQLLSLKDSVEQRSDIKPLIYTREKYTDMISLPWIFFLLLFILSLEWLGRKWGGSY